MKRFIPSFNTLIIKLLNCFIVKLPKKHIVQSFRRSITQSLCQFLPFYPSPFLKRTLLLSAFLPAFFLQSCNWKEYKGSIVVMSLNARYDNPADAPNDWQSRRPVIVNTILDKSADIIGFQEILSNQMDDLDSLLPWYDYIGAGRDDGKEKGEACPVFYKMNRFEAMDFGTLWLSENPADTGSVGWDAALPRIMTWVKFRDLHLQHDGNNFGFYFLNTHFDHMGDTARLESARVIREFIRLKTEGLNVVVTGDFNCSPDEAPYAVMVEPAARGKVLQDACRAVLTGNVKDEPTYNGFGTSTENKRIDFIFTDKNWDVMSFETLQIKESGIYISDHYPVIARIKIKSF